MKKDDLKKKDFIKSLMDKMTLGEKIGQLYQGLNDGGIVTGPNFRKSNFYNDLIKGNIGSVIGIYDNETLRGIQDIATTKTRMKIPVMNCCDIIHGCRTILPINLAMACSWNPDLLTKANMCVAYESVNSGVDLTFAPMVDLTRDARWGRVMEGNGEDPYLSKTLASAAVKGFKKGGLACTLKHYVGYGACVGGRDYDSVDMSTSTLFEYYLPPFKAGIDAGADMVMSSFNTFNGRPVTGNKYLLRHVLRDKLKFKGVVITDWASSEEMLSHHVCDNSKDIAIQTIEAGIDHEMVTRNYLDNLSKLIEDEIIDVKLVDEACERVLGLKYDLGLFDDPYKTIRNNPEDYFLNKKTLDVALQMANESMVLLENDGILPLKKNNKAEKVAYLGPYIDNKKVVGAWAAKVDFNDTITISEALKKKGVSFKTSNIQSVYNITDDEMKETLDIASECDTIVYTLGEEEEMSGESKSRANLDVISDHDKLLDMLLKLNKKIILVIFSGRPLVLTKYQKLFKEKKISAILYAWHLGTMTGDAIVNTIYGINNPSGKLAMSMPYTVGQVPVYYNHLPSGRPHLDNGNNDYRLRYIDEPINPLYPFGYGLSYSKFIYSDITLAKDEITNSEKLIVKIDVTNDSDIDGKEIVELYISSPSGYLSRPVKELKGFKKVFIKAHEMKTVEFVINPKELMYYVDEKLTPYYGIYKVYIGKDSNEEKYKEFCLKNK